MPLKIKCSILPLWNAPFDPRPWTLPSNMYAAVHPELEYALVEDQESGQRLYIARVLVETIAEKAKRTLTEVSSCSGADLIGKRYRPPMDIYYQHSASQTGALADGRGNHEATARAHGVRAIGWRPKRS